jgi:aspartyl-tRNA(Asn)/glutamyl-tRNA(Gln) amidotransferase subunit A
MHLQAEVRECFERVDLLALPASPVPAPRVGEDSLRVGGVEEPVLALLTRPNRLFSITGLPAISVPCGLTRDDLPAGLQIAGRPFDELRVLRAAQAYERDFGWRPPPALPI